jgi:hypothetical protein
MKEGVVDRDAAKHQPSKDGKLKTRSAAKAEGWKLKFN